MSRVRSARSVAVTPTKALLAVATVVAAVATAGSLYFSEVVGLVPCEFCWYQRILMYPLVVVLGVATVEDRSGVYRTALPLSTLGVGVAAYHTSLQLSPGVSCGVGGACSAILWEGLFVFTIPRLSLTAFLLLTAILGAVWRLDRGG